MRRTSLWGMVLAMLASGVTRADDVSGKIGLSGMAAAAFPAGDKSVTKNTGDVGHDFGGMLRLGLAKHLSFGFSYNNINLYGENGQRHHPEAVMANFLYHMAPDRKLVPTLQAGVGAASTLHQSAFNNAALRAGFALEYFFTSCLSVGPQIHYTYIADGGADGIDEYHSIGAGVMASVFFGGSKAEPQAAAAPPPPPPAPEPTAAVAAVPAAVRVDSDGDGVEDSKDLCPRTAAGIPVDPSGCPQKFQERVSMELKVLFDSGKAVVKPEYRSEIERVANFLSTYPEITAEIEGHTDNTGPDAVNQTISQQRADAVKAYLVKEFSVDTARVKATGYGETQPIADNTTAEGRKKNRRVVATLEAMKKSQ